ncbi:MAG: CAP domain-containing protein, partial [Candidatus Paceibacterota bacterium]
MWRNLKHLLIPHRGNGHKPHLLRDVAVEAMLGAVVVLLVVSFAGRSLAPHVDFLAAVYPSVLADLANESRAEHDLPALIESEVLAEAARLKAAHMIAEDYFEHVSPDGVTPWYWFDLVGYRYTLAGENLAINFDDSEPLNEAWMNSPAHRDNILGAGFSEVGIATAEGVLNGRNTTVVVQLFGTPARVSTDSSSPSVAGTAAESTEPEDEP